MADIVKVYSYVRRPAHSWQREICDCRGYEALIAGFNVYGRALSLNLASLGHLLRYAARPLLDVS